MTQIVQYWDWERLVRNPGVGYAQATLVGSSWWIDYYTSGSDVKRHFAEMGLASLPYPAHNETPDGLFLGTKLIKAHDPTPGILVPSSGVHKVITPKFKERCASGEIIMNPYEVWRGSLEAQPISVGSSIKQIGSSANWLSNKSLLWSSLSRQEIADWRYPDQKNYYYSYSNKLVRPDYFQAPALYLMESTEESLVSPETYGIDKFSVNNVNEHVLDIVRNIPVNGSLVQECLADANSGTMDALTAVAELPETIQSLLDGMRLLAKITRDARKREFKLYGQMDTLTEQYARSDYLRYMKKFKKPVPYDVWKQNRSKKAATYENYLRYRNRLESKIESYEAWFKRKRWKYRARAKKEVADSISDVWLNYRYNISTTIYMLEDLGETILKMSEDLYLRFRKRNVAPLVLGEYKFVGNAECTHRVLIKRQLEIASNLEKLGQLLMTDVFVTAFEMIPLWSIISDWMFSITDFLKAFRWRAPEKQQVSSYSFKTEIDGSIFLPLSNGKECEVKIQLEHYRRIIIRPDAYYGIYWKPEFSWKRQLDALAFTWNELKNPLSKKIYSYR